MNKMSEVGDELVTSYLTANNPYCMDDAQRSHLFVARPRCSDDGDHLGDAVDHYLEGRLQNVENQGKAFVKERKPKKKTHQSTCPQPLLSNVVSVCCCERKSSTLRLHRNGNIYLNGDTFSYNSQEHKKHGEHFDLISDGYLSLYAKLVEKHGPEVVLPTLLLT